MSRRQRIRAVLAVIPLAAVCLVAGCSAKSPVSLVAGTPAASASAPGAPPSASPTAPSTGLLAPLTGMTVGAGNGDRTVVVPISITSGGRGPAGIGVADLVGVDYAERDTIRLAAAFQSQNASLAGPVSSLRPSETRLFAQTGAAIAESGSPSGFLDVVRSSGLSYVSTSASGVFSTHRGRPYADTKSLRSHASKRAVTGAMFEYATAGQPVSGSKVKAISSVSIVVSGHRTMTWHYDSKSKSWRSSVNGTVVTTTNLVVLTTAYTKKYVHALKRNVMFAEPQGTGSAAIVAGPQVIGATWFKKNPGAALNMLGPDQTVPLLWPGRTWIYMIPKGSSVRVS